MKAGAEKFENDTNRCDSGAECLGGSGNRVKEGLEDRAIESEMKGDICGKDDAVCVGDI